MENHALTYKRGWFFKMNKIKYLLSQTLKAMKVKLSCRPEHNFPRSEVLVRNPRVLLWVDPEWSRGIESAELEPTGFDSADIERVEFEPAEIEPAELESVEVESIELEFAKLDYAEIESVELDSAGLDSAELESVELDWIEIESAELDSAELNPALRAPFRTPQTLQKRSRYRFVAP